MVAESHIELQNVTLSYADQLAVDGLSLKLERNCIHAITGESGSGKTSLLRVIAGLERNQMGSIRIREGVLSDAQKGIFLPPEKRKVGMVFQDNTLFPHLTVQQNIAYGLRRGEETGQVARLLSLVHLEPFAGRYPHQLSGGQAQRVALARAIAPNPDLLLMDEPFNSLDTSLKQDLLSEIKQVIQTLEIPTIFVSHSRNEVFELADTISIMQKGRIIQTGSPFDLYELPRNCYVATFFGDANFIHSKNATYMIRPEKISMSSDGNARDCIICSALVLEHQYRGDHDNYWLEARNVMDLDYCIIKVRRYHSMQGLAHSDEEFSKSGLEVGCEVIIRFSTKDLVQVEI